MRIAMMTQDTRGGVQPYAALAGALRAAGHDVVAVAPAEHTWLFDRVEVPVVGLEGMTAGDIAAVVSRGDTAHRRVSMREMSRAVLARVPDWARTVADVVAGSDIITGGIGGSMLGVPAADALGVPWVPAHLQPLGAPTGAYPGVLAVGLPRWLGRPGNRVGHTFTRLAVEVPFAPVRKAAYRTLGAEPARHRPLGAVYGISPHVLRVPSTPRRPTMTAGYWFFDEVDTLTDELEEFLSLPGPVISIGFGSMISSHPDRTRDALLGAAGGLGLRVVLIEGSGALGRGHNESEVICIPTAPHHLLFPRTIANVHHGGAGTTAAALRAGKPSVFMPFGADQPFWAGRAADLGVSAGTIPASRVTRDEIRKALQTALDDAPLQHRATVLGAAIRAENGLRTAAGWYSRWQRN